MHTKVEKAVESEKWVVLADAVDLQQLSTMQEDAVNFYDEGHSSIGDIQLCAKAQTKTQEDLKWTTFHLPQQLTAYKKPEQWQDAHIHFWLILKTLTLMYLPQNPITIPQSTQIDNLSRDNNNSNKNINNTRNKNQTFNNNNNMNSNKYAHTR